MMLVVDCPAVNERMSAYVDGRLSADERAAFELHLNTCEACRGGFKRFQAVQKLLDGTLGAAALRPGFSSETGQRMHAVTSGVLPVFPDDSFVADPHARERSFSEKVMLRLGAAPWWMVSGAFHALMLVMLTLIGMALLHKNEKEVVILTNLERRPPVEPKKEEPVRDVFKNTPMPEDESAETTDSVVVMHDEVEISDHAETNDQADASDAHGEQGLSDVMLGGTGTAASLGVGGGGGGAFGRPTGGGARLRRAVAGGGNKQTESAVDRALEWL
ncbi:MAG: zf-HC2 domain-containing protein, partial [Planctomycetota bacterium]|nr:zf-HC2 domain-containing protein [Planctomycetota bacterium]